MRLIHQFQKLDLSVTVERRALNDDVGIDRFSSDELVRLMEKYPEHDPMMRGRWLPGLAGETQGEAV